MTNIFDSLKVDGYRGLKELHLSELGQINLIVGLNNSGKTSLIEAISILCNPLDPFQWLEVADRRSYMGISGKRLMARPNLEGLKWVFAYRQDFLDRLISISAIGNTPILGIEAELREIFGSNLENVNTDDGRDSEAGPDIFGSESEYVLDGIELDVLANLELDQLTLLEKEEKRQIFQFWENERFVERKRHQPFVNVATIYPGYASAAPLLRKITPILKSKDKKTQVLEVIRYFAEKITDIQTFPTANAKVESLQIEHQDLGWVPLDVFGDGLKRTVAIAVTLMDAKNGVLLIDEIETSIHNSALSQVFSWLVTACHRLQVQLFVTTHSLEAIDAMLQAEMSTDNIVAFRLHPSGEPPQRFSGNLLHRLRYERGLDIRG